MGKKGRKDGFALARYGLSIQLRHIIATKLRAHAGRESDDILDGFLSFVAALVARRTMAWIDP